MTVGGLLLDLLGWWAEERFFASMPEGEGSCDFVYWSGWLSSVCGVIFPVVDHLFVISRGGIPDAQEVCWFAVLRCDITSQRHDLRITKLTGHMHDEHSPLRKQGKLQRKLQSHFNERLGSVLPNCSCQNSSPIISALSNLMLDNLDNHFRLSPDLQSRQDSSRLTQVGPQPTTPFPPPRNRSFLHFDVSTVDQSSYARAADLWRRSEAAV